MSSDAVRNAADKAGDMVNRASDKASEALNKAADIGSDAIEEGYDAARECADKGLDYVGNLTGQVSEFVRRDPWFTVLGAFAIGYAAAHFFRRLK